MQLVIHCSRKRETEELQVTSLEVNGKACRLSARTKKDCSRALLALFLSYKSWDLAGTTSGAFEFSPLDWGPEVTCLAHLHHNSKKLKHWTRQTFTGKGKSSDAPYFHEIVIASDAEGAPVTIELDLLSPEAVSIDIDHKAVNTAEQIQAVIEQLQAGSPSPERLPAQPRSSPRDYQAIRHNLRYDVTLSDTRFSESRISDQLKSSLYNFFDAQLEFERETNQPSDFFVVAIVSRLPSLQRWIRPGVIYREVCELHQRDREWLDTLVDRVEQAKGSLEQESLIAEVFDIKAWVNDMPVNLKRIERDQFGLSLHYPLPDKARGHRRLAFRFRFYGIQPKHRLSFPMIISEPTQKLLQRFRYSKVPIDNIGYFAGYVVGPKGEKIEVAHDEDQKILTAERKDGILLLPGEGLFVHWTPILKEDRLRLVNLRNFDARFIISSPYATNANFLNKRLYSSGELFLIEGTAKKLVAAQDALDSHGMRLIIWDAYRPTSVQRQMWKFNPDPRYVANPETGSVHNRGCAVDVSLVHRDGSPVPMPTAFDDFSENAHRENVLQKKGDATNNFRILDTAMRDAGFAGLPSEWWHYDDSDWRKYPILDLQVDPFILEEK